MTLDWSDASKGCRSQGSFLFCLAGTARPTLPRWVRYCCEKIALQGPLWIQVPYRCLQEKRVLFKPQPGSFPDLQIYLHEMPIAWHFYRKYNNMTNSVEGQR